jgi:hypothetical protein
LESSAGGLVNDLGDIGTHEVAVVAVSQTPNLRQSSFHRRINPCSLSNYHVLLPKARSKRTFLAEKLTFRWSPCRLAFRRLLLDITGLLPFFFSSVRPGTLRVKVCLSLWPSRLLAPSTHAAHNTTTVVISLFFFLNGWDLAEPSS